MECKNCIKLQQELAEVKAGLLSKDEILIRLSGSIPRYFSGSVNELGGIYEKIASALANKIPKSTGNIPKGQCRCYPRLTPGNMIPVDDVKRMICANCKLPIKISKPVCDREKIKDLILNADLPLILSDKINGDGCAEVEYLADKIITEIG